MNNNNIKLKHFLDDQMYDKGEKTYIHEITTKLHMNKYFVEILIIEIRWETNQDHLCLRLISTFEVE